MRCCHVTLEACCHTLSSLQHYYSPMFVWIWSFHSTWKITYVANLEQCITNHSHANIVLCTTILTSLLHTMSKQSKFIKPFVTHMYIGNPMQKSHHINPDNTYLQFSSSETSENFMSPISLPSCWIPLLSVLFLWAMYRSRFFRTILLLFFENVSTSKECKHSFIDWF